jgi:hypothetical protein
MANDFHKLVPFNTSKVRVPASDKTFYTSGGRHDYPQWAIVNEFDSSYYSGLDVSVYFNQIFVDECIQIQFSEMEQVRPIYGYADYTYRHVVHGTRIVQGTFTINFKDAGYIPKMLDMLSRKEQVDSELVAFAAQQAKNAQNNTSETMPYRMAASSYLQSQSGSPKTPTGKEWPPERLALSRDLSLEDIVNNQAEFDPMRYAYMMDALKQQHWGAQTANKDSEKVTEIQTGLARAKYQVPQTPTSLGFDTVIKYGRPEEPYGERKVGDKNIPRPGWGTIEVLEGCHITGYSKSIDDTGRNILEVYNFIARNVR